jgi:hypothetical protein
MEGGNYWDFMKPVHAGTHTGTLVNSEKLNIGRVSILRLIKCECSGKYAFIYSGPSVYDTNA